MINSQYPATLAVSTNHYLCPDLTRCLGQMGKAGKQGNWVIMATVFVIQSTGFSYWYLNL